MKSVYVVTEGEYSDYGIVGIFSTTDLAIEFIQKRGSTRSTTVQKWEIDEKVRHVVKNEYSSKIDFITGEIVERDVSQQFVSPHERAMETTLSQWYGDETYRYSRTLSYQSPEHADKLAIELRQKFLRENIQFGPFIPGRNEYWLKKSKSSAS